MLEIVHWGGDRWFMMAIAHRMLNNQMAVKDEETQIKKKLEWWSFRKIRSGYATSFGKRNTNI